MSSQHESTKEMTQPIVILAQDMSQEKHGDVVFACKICRKTYDNVNKGQFHETICEFRQSTEPEKLCWYCNNPCKTEYPKFICSRHGEYPDTDEEYDGVQNGEDGPGGISPPHNWEELYAEYLAQQAEKEEETSYDRMCWEAEDEAYNATHCWYCDKQCASEEEKKCHESYCKTRDHGNYSDDEW
jgi:hypothetical protein